MVDLEWWRLGGVWSWDALGWLVRELGGLIWIRRCEWSGGWWDILRCETLLRLSIAYLSVFVFWLGSLLCLITLWPIHRQLSRSCQHLNSFPCRYQISEVPVSSASHCANIRGPKSPQEIRTHLCQRQWWLDLCGQGSPPLGVLLECLPAFLLQYPQLLTSRGRIQIEPILAHEDIRQIFPTTNLRMIQLDVPL